MNLQQVRDHLVCARDHVLAGDRATAIAEIEHALHELTPERLLTPTEAAAALSIQSEIIVRLWCRHGFLSCQYQGDHVLISLAEIERVMESPEVQVMRLSDRLHDLSAAFGDDEGLDDDELRELAASRPGRLPWQRDP